MIVDFIHLFNDLVPQPCLDCSILNRIYDPEDFCFSFEWELVLYDGLEKAKKSVFNMNLYKSKLFIAIILQDLLKQRDIMIFVDVYLHAVQNVDYLFDDQILEAILLVEIGVHELFHCFTWDSVVLASFVVFYFLSVYVVYQLFQLLQRQSFCCDWSKSTSCCGCLLLGLLWFLVRRLHWFLLFGFGFHLGLYSVLSSQKIDLILELVDLFLIILNFEVFRGCSLELTIIFVFILSIYASK